jgi:hypothetical protein
MGGGGVRVTMPGMQRVGCERRRGQFGFVFSFRREGRPYSYFSLSLHGCTDGNELQGRKLLLLLFIGVFQWHNTSGRTMALGSTQPLTEMSTGVIPGGKGGRCVRLTTLPPSCAVDIKSGNLNFLEPSGRFQVCNGTALPLLLLLLLLLRLLLILLLLLTEFLTYLRSIYLLT